MKSLLLALYIAGTLAACNKPLQTEQMNHTPATGNAHTLTYLALGDSYTVGEAVATDESFPYQLAASLTSTYINVGKPDVIAVTGWTTSDLIAAINERNLKDEKYDIVTLLIGVNNQFRGLPVANYRTEFVQLLNTAIAHANGGKSHVFVLSIPDWGVTPFGQNYSPAKVAAEIDKFNAVNKAETLKAGVNYVDITPISRSGDTGLVAGDGLHPSAKAYSLWVAELMKAIRAQIKP